MRKFFSFKELGFLLVIVLLGGSPLYASKEKTDCPGVKTVSGLLHQLSSQEVQVLSVRPSPVKGLCEVVVQQNGRKGVTYVDLTGKFLVLGRLIEISTKKDLTGARIQELNKIVLSPEKIKELRKYVAFSAGQGPEIFLITDPDCPFCRKAEDILWPLVQKKKIRVNVVFFPLDRLHPEAHRKAVALICEKKGFEDLVAGYSGNATCPEGENKVTQGQKFLLSLGIRGTPTYIFPSGETHSGVLPAERLLEMVKK
ncbi:DsbC family protein [Thermosulfurimonas marina]|uniref:DsbC family protein n=1 Tax=Thermosulfurimonas marina TaxID=2047767 RepID=A0A6H1WQH5_9BACT|nr:DsbC family protein [Thermosulfurimonas marina]QJA05410.1 DsbC family protein [Thermosulfurimonas marina]